MLMGIFMHHLFSIESEQSARQGDMENDIILPSNDPPVWLGR